MWVARRPLNRRAFDSALAIHKMPREICLALGADVLKSDTGVDNIMEALQNNLGPDASDAARRDITMFPGLRQTHLTLEEHSAHFQSARQRAEARLPNGGAFPEASLSSLRIHNAGLMPNQGSAINLTHYVSPRTQKACMQSVYKGEFTCGDRFFGVMSSLVQPRFSAKTAITKMTRAMRMMRIIRMIYSLVRTRRPR